MSEAAAQHDLAETHGEAVIERRGATSAQAENPA